MQQMKTQRPCCTVIVLGANFSLMLVSHFLLHIEYTGPNIVSFRERWDSVFFLEAYDYRNISEAFNLAAV